MNKSAEAFFFRRLREAYATESEMAMVLDVAGQIVSNESLRRTILGRRDVAKKQQERIEKVFKMSKKKARRSARETTLRFGHDLKDLAQKESPERDLSVAGLLLEITHFEHGTYQLLTKVAYELGMTRVSMQLEKSMNEEEQAGEELADLLQELSQGHTEAK